MRRIEHWSPASGRDTAIRFRITEMDAFTCEQWARRALGVVARSLSGPDDALLSMMTSSIRDVFVAEEPEPVAVPKDSASPRTAEVVANEIARRKEEANQKTEDKREDAPMNLAALIGLRVFLQLGPDEQDTVMTPLLSCCDVQCDGDTWMPVIEDGAIPRHVRNLISDASTVARLKAKAFGLHADFFTPAARSIAERMILAAEMKAMAGQSPGTSPAPSQPA
ncbi:hypothetical protein CO583_01885 [Parasaccharibacter sp. TMW2.1882]|uniref:hypothetical protein n=1 Tax=Parasaccharibacter sp. TMW2.1882 TaxID=2039286 RepID=UPI00201111AC|nr:hypothetical protein [Parasaccharibacter sp. TMW2.1882]MCL1496260.1 hypothetical protein [Parasaccharibacter sp. TMW2.1882]